MTDQPNTTPPLPEMGRTHMPIYAHDQDHVVTESMRVFMTSTIHAHEQRVGADIEEGTLPCLSLSIPCYLDELSTSGYTAALRQTTNMLSVITHEAHRLGYTVLAATPAMYGVPEDATYQTPSDRAPGWKVEVAADKYMPQLFDGDKDHNTLTRLWLELSIKSHGPSYVHVMQEAQAGNEVQRSLQDIMGRGDLRA